jgi:hypothetical protein
MAVGMAATPPAQLLNDLFESVEAVYDQVITKKMPTNVLAALHTDIDDHKRFVKEPAPHDPSGKGRDAVEVKIHQSRNSSRPGPVSSDCPAIAMTGNRLLRERDAMIDKVVGISALVGRRRL